MRIQELQTSQSFTPKYVAVFFRLDRGFLPQQCLASDTAMRGSSPDGHAIAVVLYNYASRHHVSHLFARKALEANVKTEH